MKNKVTIAACTALLLAGTAVAFTESGSKQIKEILLGVKEVPVVSTTGHGTFEAEIDEDAAEIKYTLSFAALEGNVTQAHIHVAPEQNTGNIVLWLCQTAATAAAAATAGVTPPLCFDPLVPAQARANTVSGVLKASDIVVQTTNGIDARSPEEFREIIALVRAGKAYANVHTAKSPAGEIRAQLEHDHSGGQ